MNRSIRNWIAASSAVVALIAGMGVLAYSAPENNFHFSILGDRTGRAAPGIYESVWSEVGQLKPAFVINVGDTIEGGDDARAQQEWLALRPLWERSGQYPIYFTPGNHDVFSSASQKIYEQQTKRSVQYSFDYEQAHFTVLDNSRTEDLPESQLEFLRKDLEKNKNKSPKFIFFHRPFWIPYVMFKSGAFALHQIAKQYGVTCIINGHMHQFMHMTQDGITYMVVGSSGGSIARGLNAGQGFREGWFYQHISAQVKGGSVNFTVKEIDGPQGKGRTFKAEDWDRSGPKFDVNLVKQP
jgi:predicted phosphodiesterase